MNPIIDILKRSKQLIVDHGWIQKAAGSKACGFCIYGAVQATASELDRTIDVADILRSLGEAVSEIPGERANIIEWNDSAGRNQDEVLSLFDQVIELHEELDQ